MSVIIDSSGKATNYRNGSFSGNLTLLMDTRLCTVETCDLSLASFMYIPTLGGNALFAAIFGLLLLAQLGLGIRYKTWGYMVAMIFGLLLEIIGYAARISLHNNPFNNDMFLMYLVTLTIAPAFLTASIYLCLGRIVTVYGEHLSFFKPRTYTIVFCTLDFICLVLQAVGGAIASTANDEASSDLGKNIMLAGLICQVVCIVIFTGFAAEFAMRVFKGREAWNIQHAKVYNSLLFKSFLAGLLIATITILVRCLYRCVELSGGFSSDLFISHEALFMVFEGVMIIIACVCLTFFHPAVCFQGTWHAADFKFRTQKLSREDKLGSPADK